MKLDLHTRTGRGPDARPARSDDRSSRAAHAPEAGTALDVLPQPDAVRAGPARGADPDGSAPVTASVRSAACRRDLTGCAGRAGVNSPTTALWSRKEVVIENDIAWHPHDGRFHVRTPGRHRVGQPDPAKRRLIERVLEAVWEASGGIALMQDLAAPRARLRARRPHRPCCRQAGERFRLGSVRPAQPRRRRNRHHAARCVRVEVVEPTRGVAAPQRAGLPQDQRLCAALPASDPLCPSSRRGRRVRRGRARSAGSGLLRRLMGNAGRAQDPVSPPAARVSP